MVSFFGLKLGADKKKKTEKAPEPKPARKRIDQNMLGEGQFFGSNLERPVLINGSRPGTSQSNKNFVANFAHPNAPYLTGGGSGSRPGTAMSNKNFVANFRHPNAPYLNGGSSSMVDLGGPGKGGVRPMGSESNLNMAWYNSSMTKSHTMPTPPIITGGSRPGTPGTPNSPRKWVHPLDVHYNRDGALSPAPSGSAASGPNSPGFPQSHTPSHAPSAAPSVSNAPRSPLGQFEFNLNPSELPKDETLTPAPLAPNKGYPSPPQSVNGSLPPIKIDARPKTAVNTVRDVHRPVPASLPSPTTSAERSSEEERPYPRPIIQNVAAKRDTLTSLTFNSPRRQSFSMDIDEDSTGFKFGIGEQPSGPTFPPPRSALRPSPPELKSLPQLPVQAQAQPPKSPGVPPPRPAQTPYEGPLRGPARPPEELGNGRERLGSDPRERENFVPRERMNSDARERTNEARERQNSDPREMITGTRIPQRDRGPQPPGYLGPPPASKRVAPGVGERSYGITPANRRQPPPPVELQRKASNPTFQQPRRDDRDVQHKNFAMVSPQMQPQPPTSNGCLTPEPSIDANWPLPSPLASPTFGTGQRPYTPSEQSEGQMSPGPAMPGRDQARDLRRPDFGLRAPTGIADEFRVGFI